MKLDSDEGDPIFSLDSNNVLSSGFAIDRATK
jgi:hypothetical protein